MFPHGLSLVSLAPGVDRWIARYGSVNSCAHFVAGVPCLLDSGQPIVVRSSSCHNSCPQGVVCVLVYMMDSLSCICSSAVSFIRNALVGTDSAFAFQRYCSNLFLLGPGSAASVM